MSNIIEHPVVTAEKVESLWNVAGSELNQGEIHATLSLEHYALAGAALASLRDQNPQDVKFGVACAEHEIFLKPQIRAAVIWWGRLSDEQRETLIDWFPASLTPKSIQDQCRNEKPEWLKFEKKSGIPSGDTTIEILPAPEIQPNTTPIEPEPMKAEEKSCQESINSPIEITPISKKKRVYSSVVNDFYVHKSTSMNVIKEVLGNKLSKFAKIILTGKLGESSAYNFSNVGSLTPRALFMDYPKRWTFGDVRGLSLLDHIDEVIEHHNRCGSDFSKVNCNAIVKEMEREREVVLVSPTIKINIPSENGSVRGGSDAPMGIENIIVAGVVIWDRENPMGVDHKEVWYAFHTFKHMIGSVPVEDHADFARGLQGATRYMNGIMIDTAVNAIRLMADAVQKSPEKHATETSAAHPATRHAKS